KTPCRLCSAATFMALDTAIELLLLSNNLPLYTSECSCSFFNKERSMPVHKKQNTTPDPLHGATTEPSSSKILTQGVEHSPSSGLPASLFTYKRRLET